MAVLAIGPALLASYCPDPCVTGVWLYLTGAGVAACVAAVGAGFAALTTPSAA